MTHVSFMDFVLDLRSGDLRRNGASIDLRPKLHALLVQLVEHAGQLIPKDQLIAAVWGDTHVADGSLNRAITELREILGDDPQKPRLIETIPRRGYRFIAAVSSRPAARTMSPFLIVHGDRRLPLFHGENIIGRTPDCEIQLAFHSVSRRHAQLLVSDRVSIKDLGSTNGTYVRDQRVDSERELEPGDDIRIGKEIVRLISEQMLHAPTDRID